MNTIITRTYQAKEREEGAAFVLYALAQRNLFFSYQQITGDKSRESYIRSGGNLYAGDDPEGTPQAEQDSVRELLDAADKAIEDGYRLKEGPRRMFGLAHDIPAEALAWRLVPAGHIATTEAWRLQYVVRAAGEPRPPVIPGDNVIPS